ncbi:MAG: acyl carrier protein [Clostridium sp.]|nr:acyl carrier protein [Clostridium sp.]
MIFEEIRDVICEKLEVEKEEVAIDTTFEELGADSLDLFEVVIELEEKYNIELEDAEKIKTVADAVKYVEEKVNANK